MVRWTKDGTISVEAAGQTFGPYTTSHGMVRNPAATAVAWATDEGEVMAWADGESEPFVLSETGPRRRTRRRGHGHRLLRQADQCTFFVSGYDFDANTTEVFTLTSTGERGDVDPDGLLLSVRDATDDGRLLGVTSIDELDPVVVLGRARTGRDGLDSLVGDVQAHPRHVLAERRLRARQRHLRRRHRLRRDRGVRRRDRRAAGRPEEHAARPGFYNSAVWEDETHVLFTRFQDGQWSMVRMDVDGAMEYAIAPQKGNQDNVPWRFETR